MIIWLTFLRNMMPHATVIRKNYNIDVWKKLADYRKQIPQIKNTREFAVLVASALYACKGHHLGLKRLSPSMNENYLKTIYGKVDTKLSVMRNHDLVTYANKVLFYTTPHFHKPYILHIMMAITISLANLKLMINVIQIN